MRSFTVHFDTIYKSSNMILHYLQFGSMGFGLVKLSPPWGWFLIQKKGSSKQNLCNIPTIFNFH